MTELDVNMAIAVKASTVLMAPLQVKKADFFDLSLWSEINFECTNFAKNRKIYWVVRAYWDDKRETSFISLKWKYAMNFFLINKFMMLKYLFYIIIHKL